MTPAELVTAYARVAKRHGLPKMQNGTLSVETQNFADPDAAWDAFRKQAPMEGWVQFQSCVMVFTRGRLPPPEPDWGFLLAAEGVNAGGHSLLLRQGSLGALVLVIAKPDGGADEAFLIDEVTHLGTAKAPGPLRYRRYWRPGAAMGPVPIFAAFIGFVA